MQIQYELLKHGQSEYLKAIYETRGKERIHGKSLLTYVHPKNNNHLRSHSRAITAPDHSGLGLENKSGRIFCVR